MFKIINQGKLKGTDTRRAIHIYKKNVKNVPSKKKPAE
jgi:hypothetical protein